MVNGFCEMLIESMLFSQIYKTKYVAKAFHGVKITKHKVQSDKTMLLVQNSMVQTSQPKSSHGHVNKFDFREERRSVVEPPHSKIVYSSPIVIPMEGSLAKLANIDADGKVKARRYSKRISSVVLLFYCLSEQFCEV